MQASKRSGVVPGWILVLCLVIGAAAALGVVRDSLVVRDGNVGPHPATEVATYSAEIPLAGEDGTSSRGWSTPYTITYVAQSVPLIVEATLAEAGAIRFNTDSGEQPPLDTPWASRSWMTYVPLRFTVTSVITDWLGLGPDGFIAVELLEAVPQWTPEPGSPDRSLGGVYDPWIRAESLHSQPGGLALVYVLSSDELNREPWGRYIGEQIESLNAMGAVYVAGVCRDWYEYIGTDAMRMPPQGRTVPRAQLLREINRALTWGHRW